ncbi:MAG: hypothetical protein U1G07_12810 [Verrucomicrobiota bacterium]
MSIRFWLLRSACLVVFALPTAFAAETTLNEASAWQTGTFKWLLPSPVLSPADRPNDPCYSVKDPSVVYFEGRWHLFSTIRSVKRSHQIEYVSFKDWTDAPRAPRHVLTLTNGYFCAPQVFYFTPQQRWYLICQALDSNRKVPLQPAFSTSPDLSRPQSWRTSPGGC